MRIFTEEVGGEMWHALCSAIACKGQGLYSKVPTILHISENITQTVQKKKKDSEPFFQMELRITDEIIDKIFEKAFHHKT